MVLAMLGALHPRAGLSLFLHLILAVALLHSIPVPEGISAPLELSRSPILRPATRGPRGPRTASLSRAQQAPPRPPPWQAGWPTLP
uniref:Uncharacterized protein n=1 Tax=Cercocebus atys TaxID=9531 RepID=A0A2K5MI68_CERAT